MTDNPIVAINIHGGPRSAKCHSDIKAVVISTSDFYFCGTAVTFFCPTAAFAEDLAAAINSTIEAHAADLSQRASIQEAAE